MSLLRSGSILSLDVRVTAAILGVPQQEHAHGADRRGDPRLPNLLLGWIVFVIFTVATLGLAWRLASITPGIINAILLKLTDALTDHLRIGTLGWALLGAQVMSAPSTLGQWLIMPCCPTRHHGVR